MRTALLILSGLIAACGSLVYHRVQPGDTLYSISWRYAQDYREIARWNGIGPPYVIHTGDWVRVAPPNDGTQVAVEERTITVIPASAPELEPIAVPQAPPKVIPRKPPESPSPTPVAPLRWAWPARGQVLASLGKGVDIGGRMGQPVYAAATGRVVYAGNGLSHYGNLIILKHDDTYLSAYAHNRVLRVQEGDTVKAGQHIADMGGRNDGLTVLHFEIRKDGTPVDPLKYLPAPPLETFP